MLILHISLVYYNEVKVNVLALKIERSQKVQEKNVDFVHECFNMLLICRPISLIILYTEYLRVSGFWWRVFFNSVTSTA